MNWGIEILPNKAGINIIPNGNRIIDGLDFTNEPFLAYCEARWGLANIFINEKPINSAQYKLIKENESSKKNCD